MLNIIAWIVLGAIAGYVAGLIVKGDERWGVIGHIVLGIVGALVGGFLADRFLGIQTGAGSGDINIASIVVSVIGAIIVVVIVNALTGRRRAV